MNLECIPTKQIFESFAFVCFYFILHNTVPIKQQSVLFGVFVSKLVPSEMSPLSSHFDEVCAMEMERAVLFNYWNTIKQFLAIYTAFAQSDLKGINIFLDKFFIF